MWLRGPFEFSTASACYFQWTFCYVKVCRVVRHISTFTNSKFWVVVYRCMTYVSRVVTYNFNALWCRWAPCSVFLACDCVWSVSDFVPLVTLDVQYCSIGICQFICSHPRFCYVLFVVQDGNCTVYYVTNWCRRPHLGWLTCCFTGRRYVSSIARKRDGFISLVYLFLSIGKPSVDHCW